MPSDSVKVSIVVPVWNPGPNIQRCLDGLLGQTMPDTDYEIVFVDDGSTDGTGEYLDALARATAEPHVEVVHLANSGGPGKPRNVGVSTARGEYVHFVDNDDTLAPTALAALYDLARRCTADIVIGKPASNFRFMNHRVYRRNVVGTTLAESPWLVETLTPHKMFRRQLLLDHDIRHPEGPVPFEDQLFVVQAYVHARSIAVLADTACYYYLRRLGSGRHAGDRRMVPSEHCRAVLSVLDVIEAGVDDPALRDRLFRRFYRTSVLGPLAGRAMIDYDAQFRGVLMRDLHELATTRFAPAVHDGSAALHRIQGRMFLDGDTAGLVALAEVLRRVALRVETATPHWAGDALELDLAGELRVDGTPLRCERVNDRWALPRSWAPDIPPEERELDAVRDDVDVELSVASRVDHDVSFPLVDGLQVGVDDDGCIRVAGTVRLDPLTAMGGAALNDGVWELRLRLSFAGINRTVALRPVPSERDAPPADPEAYLTVPGTPIAPRWTGARPVLTIDVGQWRRSLAEIMAERVTLAAGPDRAVELTVPLRSAYGARMPAAELVLRPQGDGPPGLVVADVPLERRSEHSLAGTATPPLPGSGSWRVWLRFGGSVQAPAVELPWTVRRSGRDLYVERVR